MNDSCDADSMWRKSCFIMRLISSCVHVSESAGNIIKGVIENGNLGLVNKGSATSFDPQTEADRASQCCIIHSLQNKFGRQLTVIGEEDDPCATPVIDTGFSAAVLKYDSMCLEEYRNIEPNEVVVWADPLDGTFEFSEAAKTGSSLLQSVTVLIGIAVKGKAVAGIIHQPFWGDQKKGRTIWGLAGIGVHGIDVVQDNSRKVVVTTRSHSNKSVTHAIDALKNQGLADEVESVGGAGYKVIRCLEGAAAYVFASPGCKKWDTAAPEAVLVAAGGKLTDISGRTLYYGADAQIINSGGVLATPRWINHDEYVNSIPNDVKNSLPEFMAVDR
ncbi:hypothetical protein AB6A40_007697 [Gnathostoma spinigerum]|uniref:3'(2'),5'-bisphosphate nucleotidase 1 n=1 Tax=Gnathostoma spinigerum TaxID=75299 RepID=A0ABD6EM83_9BILA